MPNIVELFKKLAVHLIVKKNIYTPMYKLVEVLNKEDEYFVVIKLVEKNVTFQVKPEEILANDALVDKFSPRDIRTLTYLGYLGINSPKYKILAKRLSTDNDKIIFALKKKGANEIITKTADQISQEKDIILNLNSDDARTVGYIMASESTLGEKQQQELLLQSAREHKEI